MLKGCMLCHSIVNSTFPFRFQDSKELEYGPVEVDVVPGGTLVVDFPNEETMDSVENPHASAPSVNNNNNGVAEPDPLTTSDTARLEPRRASKEAKEEKARKEKRIQLQQSEHRVELAAEPTERDRAGLLGAEQGTGMEEA